jgi:hypothetical protein
VRAEPPAIALQREQAAENGGLLSDTERAALTKRLDTCPTKADWALWSQDLAARVAANDGKKYWRDNKGGQ